jgi:response regulator of citrate/malate metabolism
MPQQLTIDQEKITPLEFYSEEELERLKKGFEASTQRKLMEIFAVPGELFQNTEDRQTYISFHNPFGGNNEWKRPRANN